IHLDARSGIVAVQLIGDAFFMHKPPQCIAWIERLRRGSPEPHGQRANHRCGGGYSKGRDCGPVRHLEIVLYELAFCVVAFVE
ncbi:MAG: hypothetical protein WB869_22115, partial [Candidatus Acidiferrales bacterium]